MSTQSDIEFKKMLGIEPTMEEIIVTEMRETEDKLFLEAVEFILEQRLNETRKKLYPSSH